MKFTEAYLESVINELLGAKGYPHVLGEATDPADAVVGLQPQDVLICADLRAFLAKQHVTDDITPQEIESMLKQFSDFSTHRSLQEQQGN